MVVYNIMGKEVAVYQNVTDSKLEIDISDLSKGIYTIKSTDENGVRNAIILCK